MIVIVIIGLLVSITIPSYQSYKRKANIARTAVEMRRFSSAFMAYLAEYQTFPIDAHLVLPPGMDQYIDPIHWANATPLGGNYNWEGPDNYPYAGLSIFQPTAPLADLQTLDHFLDNGDLATGKFRWGTGGRPTLIIDE
jgi:type IV pilus assembly protein PilA